MNTVLLWFEGSPGNRSAILRKKRYWKTIEVSGVIWQKLAPRNAISKCTISKRSVSRFFLGCEKNYSYKPRIRKYIYLQVYIYENVSFAHRSATKDIPLESSRCMKWLVMFFLFSSEKFTFSLFAVQRLY